MCRTVHGDAAIAALAATQHGVVSVDFGGIHVSVAGRNPRAPAGVRIHRSRRLEAGDIARRDGLPLTSPSRTLLLALVRAGRLSTPELNVHLGRHQVDFLWRDPRLVVEVDGYVYHSSRAAFERDRLRDAELQAMGFIVMLVTWKQIVEEPEALLVRLAQAVTRPSQRLSSREWR